MNPDDFEKRLQQQPLRPLPTDWRQEILQNVKSSSRSQPSTLNSQPGLSGWLRELLWPCPQAWAGLAAVWLVILGTNVVTSEPTSSSAKQADFSSPQRMLAIREQRELLSQLIAPRPPTEVAEPPKTFGPRPRSERRLEILAA